jgi:hypothetical protein
MCYRAVHGVFLPVGGSALSQSTDTGEFLETRICYRASFWAVILRSDGGARVRNLGTRGQQRRQSTPEKDEAQAGVDTFRIPIQSPTLFFLTFHSTQLRYQIEEQFNPFDLFVLQISGMNYLDHLVLFVAIILSREDDMSLHSRPTTEYETLMVLWRSIAPPAVCCFEMVRALELLQVSFHELSEGAGASFLDTYSFD